jgi:hypothetical protein
MFYFENVAIYNNWLEENFVNKVSIIDASVELFNKYITHSLILPGLGQVKRGQNFAGYTFISLTGATIISTIAMESMRQVMLTKLRLVSTSIIYRDAVNTYGTLRNISLIGFGTVYIFNVIHSITFKPKNYNVSFMHYPEFDKQSFMCSIMFKF